MAPYFASKPDVGVTGVGSEVTLRQIAAMIAAGTDICWVAGRAAPKNVEVSRDFFGDVEKALASRVPDCLLMFDEASEVLGSAECAISRGVRTIVITSERVPVHDAVKLREAARAADALVIGPGSTGLFVPSMVKAGFFSDDVSIGGDIGVIAKSGSLAYAVMTEMRGVGLGTSGVASIGGDLVKVAGFVDLIPHLERDGATRAILLLGEIGGTEEERAADVISRGVTKPVVAFISGRSMVAGSAAAGHAGAIIRNGVGDYETKVRRLRSVGVRVAERFGDIVPLLSDATARVA